MAEKTIMPGKQRLTIFKDSASRTEFKVSVQTIVQAEGAVAVKVRGAHFWVNRTCREIDRLAPGQPSGVSSKDCNRAANSSGSFRHHDSSTSPTLIKSRR